LDTANTQVKQDFLGVMAHDMKGPLNQIMLSAELLETKLKKEQTLTNEQQSLIAILRNGCVNAVDMINDLQEAQDLDIGKSTFHPQAVTLKKYLDPLLTRYEEMVKNKGFRLKILIPEKDIYLNIDEYKLTRVLNNIMSNALKYSHQNDPILIEIAAPADVVEIAITDMGIGIPKDLQPYVFDKFSRAKRKGLHGERSIGLGMYISKMIVEAHSGEISFESIPNLVTTFKVKLPINS
jgi:two-component system sensor histidine kinase VicK